MPKTSQLLSQPRPDASEALLNELREHQDALSLSGYFIRYSLHLREPWFMAQTALHRTQLFESTSHTLKLPYLFQKNNDISKSCTGSGQRQKMWPNTQFFFKWNFSGMSFSSLPTSLSLKAQVQRNITSFKHLRLLSFFSFQDLYMKKFKEAAATPL